MVERTPCSRTRTSVLPLWLSSTSPSLATSGGVTLTVGMEMLTGALVPTSVRSGTISSMATSRGMSSRLSSRPLTKTTASSISWVDTSW